MKQISQLSSISDAIRESCEQREKERELYSMKKLESLTSLFLMKMKRWHELVLVQDTGKLKMVL